MNDQLFAGRVALVTGAGAGIGLAIAQRLARAGASVTIAEINAETGQKAAESIAKACGQEARVFFQPTDVRQPEEAAAAVAATMRQFGRLDILVNNAGGSPRKPFLDISDADWHNVLELNLNSIFHLAQYAQPHLAASRHGTIINIASMHAMMTVKGLSAYAAAKGGVIALTRSLALEFAPDIRVNAVVPGLIETEGWLAAVNSSEAVKQERATFHPLGRIGKPEDIASAVAFLASEDAVFITGITLPVDGGLTAQLYR
jgi:NAD(P)-dependent dehydrogenase (short-subunit alcohol dehydrogenase family)